MKFHKENETAKAKDSFTYNICPDNSRGKC